MRDKRDLTFGIDFWAACGQKAGDLRAGLLQSDNRNERYRTRIAKDFGAKIHLRARAGGLMNEQRIGAAIGFPAGIAAQLRIEVLPKQVLSDRKLPACQDGVASEAPPGSARSKDGDCGPVPYYFASSAGIVQTLRTLHRSPIEAQYLAFSLRDEIVWDEALARRVVAEIGYFSSIYPDWLLLAANGRDAKDRELTAAYFYYEPDPTPSVTPSRDRHAIGAASGLLYVFNLRALCELGHLTISTSQIENSINAAIMRGYLRGKASFFSPRLYPCFLGMRYVSIPSLSNNFHCVFPIVKAAELAATGSELNIFELEESFHRTVDTIKVTRSISFVVRTLFRRPYLLNRCLISIDYLRRSMGVPVQVVLASDVDVGVAREHITEIKSYFPGIEFVLADGGRETGVSRVRNLKAGIKASTGELVCIIDDDDYYLPSACPEFARTQSVEYNRLLLLGAQTVNEKWVATEHKHERHLISCGQAFPAENWFKTFTGANQLPLCSVIYPGEFIRGLIGDYRFSYDLSEDLILHLMVFGHPRRPEVETTRGICVHQSHRENGDNVANVVDRTNWTLDTGNGVFELLFENGWQFERLPDGRERDEAMIAAHRLVDALLPITQARSPDELPPKARNRRLWRVVKSKLSLRSRAPRVAKKGE